jgi:hypothetical protein
MQTAGDPSTAECITGVATSGDEARKLIEAGFDYALTTPNGLMIFKNRKQVGFSRWCRGWGSNPFLLVVRKLSGAIFARMPGSIFVSARFI